MTDNTYTHDELAFVVIVEPDGPFACGELIVCAELPGTGVREVGYPGRKPLKWDCEYERFPDLWDAIERAAEIAPWGGTPKSLHRGGADVH